MRNTIHLSVTKRLVPTRFDVVQYATAPEIEFYISDWTPSGIAQLYIEKPSGAKVYDSCVIEGQSIFFTPTTQAFAEVGVNKCQLEILDGEQVVLSFIMYANVVENIVDSSAIESTDEFTALERALNSASNIDTKLATMQSNLTSDIAKAKSEAISESSTNTQTAIANYNRNLEQNVFNPLDNRVTANEEAIADIQNTVGYLPYGAGNAPDSPVASIPNATGTTVGTVTLETGIYIVSVAVRFDSNATGRRDIVFSTSNTTSTSYAVLLTDYRQAVNGSVTQCMCTGIVRVTDPSKTFYIRAYQNSGGALGVVPRVGVVKVK